MEGVGVDGRVANDQDVRIRNGPDPLWLQLGPYDLFVTLRLVFVVKVFVIVVL